jgi:uncharacterized protein YdbL (DUF1318 family)
MTAMKTSRIFCLFALIALVVAAGTAALRAEDLGAVKQRMAQRLAAIDGLKGRGAVGENNRGFLEARGPLGGGDNGVIAAENAARSTVYAALAAQTGSSAEQVGRARAKQIAQGSQPGVWVQDEGGGWRQK